MGREEKDLIRCANCARAPRPDDNAANDWRVESDGVGELLVFCPECWQREFGEWALRRSVTSVHDHEPRWLTPFRTTEEQPRRVE